MSNRRLIELLMINKCFAKLYYYGKYFRKCTAHAYGWLNRHNHLLLLVFIFIFIFLIFLLFLCVVARVFFFFYLSIIKHSVVVLPLQTLIYSTVWFEMKENRAATKIWEHNNKLKPRVVQRATNGIYASQPKIKCIL